MSKYDFYDSSKFSDSGSGLGRFYYSLFNGNETLANLGTRGTIYLLLVIAFLPVYWR
jgi:hypothetical protein